MSLRGRIGRYEELVRLIGPKLTAVVSARLSGKRITIGKKSEKVYLVYCRSKHRYDRMRPCLAAEILGCTIRYFKKLKAMTNSIRAEG